MFGEEMFGNAPLLQNLSSLLVNGRLPHAMIIEGDDGLGKTTLSRLIASALLCTDGIQLLCGQCVGCDKVRRNIHPDFEIITGVGKSNAIPISEIRRLHSEAYIQPNEGECRVYLLEDCDNMQQEAQNALLKLFEEPPGSTAFILTARSSMNLLETIRSRAAVFTLLPVTPEEGMSAIRKASEGASNPPNEEQMRDALLTSSGNIGAALSILSGDTEGNTQLMCMRLADALAMALCSDFEHDFLKAAANLPTDRLQFADVLTKLRMTLRTAVLLSAGAREDILYPTQAARKLSSCLTAERLLAVIDALPQIERAVSLNIDIKNLIPTVLCSKLRQAAGK